MDDKGNGCGLLFAGPPECNDNTEFIHHAQILHVKAPEVIDKKGNLRPMVKEELEDHKSKVNKVITVHLKSYQRKYPKNEWKAVQLPDTEQHYVHEFQPTLERGTYEKTITDTELKKIELADKFISVINRVTLHIVKCQCGKEAMRTEFTETMTKDIPKAKTSKKKNVENTSKV